MTRNKASRSSAKIAGLTLLGTLAVFWTSQNLGAQEQKGTEEPRVRDVGTAPSLVLAGYTRPGNPSDRAKSGKIIPGGYLAGDPDFKGVGATVFFAVYRLTNDDGDVWGTGVKDFDNTFVAGSDFNSADSPALDKRAKYLYLYQVVNSRGLDPVSPVAFAVNKDKGTEPIATAAVRLRVDPRYITSWGHFKTTGFTLAVVPGEKGKPGAVKPAMDGDKEGAIRMAVSVNPSILGSLAINAYLFGAPSYPLQRVNVNGATLNLANSEAIKGIQKRVDALGNNKPAAWVSEMLKAAKAATEPSAVRLVMADQDARLYLQADWLAKASDGLLNLADHSTVFGFTSDLPPVPEPVGVATPEGRERLLPVLGMMAAEGSGGPAAGNAPAVGEGPGGMAPGAAVGVAPGTAVGPIQPAAFAPDAGANAACVPPSFGTALPALGGFGAGLPGGLGVGAIGRAFPGVGGGGGTGSGGGSGNGGGNAAQQQQQKQAQQGNQIVNVNVLQSNQQTQVQVQAQAQAQAQHQRQGNNQHVVPEPGTLILGLLGLPGLFYLYRRGKAAPVSADND
jgi:hypothetical protein